MFFWTHSLGAMNASLKLLSQEQASKETRANFPAKSENYYPEKRSGGEADLRAKLLVR